MKGVQSKWPAVTLGEVCEFKYGKSLPESARAGGEVPVYGSNGVVGRHLEALTDGPTIVIGRKGSYGEINYSPVSCWPIDTTYYVDHTSTKADLGWLAYRLSSLGLNKLNKAAAVPGLNREDAYRQRLLLPPLPEQRWIAAILDKADALRAKRRAALAQLATLTQSVFLDTFSSKPNQFPLVRLSEVCEEDAPITYGILQPGPDLQDGVPYVRPTEIKNGKITLSEIRRTSPEIASKYQKSVLRAGDILITIVGTIGNIAVVPKELEGANITQSSARVRVNPNKAHPQYVEYFLRSPLAIRQYDKHRLGVAVERLNLHHVRDLELPLPALELQREFAKQVSVAENLKSTGQLSLSEFDALFSALESRAFRGEL